MEKRILLIDDDFSLRKVISRALSSSKISVKSVSTLSEAWVTIEKNNFDLIICDVMLPDGDGLELVEFSIELLQLKNNNIIKSQELTKLYFIF